MFQEEVNIVDECSSLLMIGREMEKQMKEIVSMLASFKGFEENFEKELEAIEEEDQELEGKAKGEIQPDTYFSWKNDESLEEKSEKMEAVSISGSLKVSDEKPERELENDFIFSENFLKPDSVTEAEYVDEYSYSAFRSEYESNVSIKATNEVSVLFGVFSEKDVKNKCAAGLSMMSKHGEKLLSPRCPYFSLLSVNEGAGVGTILKSLHLCKIQRRGFRYNIMIKTRTSEVVLRVSLRLCFDPGGQDPSFDGELEKRENGFDPKDDFCMELVEFEVPRLDIPLENSCIFEKKLELFSEILEADGNLVNGIIEADLTFHCTSADIYCFSFWQLAVCMVQTLFHVSVGHNNVEIVKFLLNLQGPEKVDDSETFCGFALVGVVVPKAGNNYGVCFNLDELGDGELYHIVRKKELLVTCCNEPFSNRFAAVKQCVYKIGIRSGWKGMYILDIETGKWKKVPLMIESRYRPRIGNDTICVIRGCADRANNKPNGPSLFAEFYSHALNKWMPIPHLSLKFEHESMLLAAALHPPITTLRGDNNNNEFMVIVGYNDKDRMLCRYHIANLDLVQLQFGPNMISRPIHQRFPSVVVDYKLIWFPVAWLFVYDIMQQCDSCGNVAGLDEDFLDLGHDSKVLLDICGGYLCLICLPEDASSLYYPSEESDAFEVRNYHQQCYGHYVSEQKRERLHDCWNSFGDRIEIFDSTLRTRSVFEPVGIVTDL